MKKVKSHPNVYIIAGPNGAGKTTFAVEFLPVYTNCKNFVNADLIAKGVAPFAPESVAIKAGKILLEQIHSLSAQREDFAFETTLAGKSYAIFIKALKKRGYVVHIFYLWIPNVNLALARIKERVTNGGHHIPAKDVNRRFSKSLKNFFKHFKPLADHWAIIDNSAVPPHVIAQGDAESMYVMDEASFRIITNQEGD